MHAYVKTREKFSFNWQNRVYIVNVVRLFRACGCLCDACASLSTLQRCWAVSKIVYTENVDLFIFPEIVTVRQRECF